MRRKCIMLVSLWDLDRAVKCRLEVRHVRVSEDVFTLSAEDKMRRSKRREE